MKRNILFFTLFLMFNLLCHTVYSGDYKTLIDFSIFEKKIRENNTYKNVDDKFNEEIFDLKSIPQKINIFQFENEILKKQSDNPQINDILTYYSKYDKSGNYYLRDGLDNNSKEKVVELLKSVGYSFRKKIYNDPNSISAEEQIMIKDAYIPWFKVTTRDMDLDRWVIQFDSYGKQNYRSKLAEEAFSPFYEMKGKKEKMLGARIHFPLSSDDIKIDLKPSFEIYQYDQEGKLSNINNGVLNNVGDIEKIAITLGFKGEISNIAISIKLQDHLGEIKEYPMGFIYSYLVGKLKYFKDYDGISFKNTDEITNLDTIKDNSLYYKVYYRNNEPVLWVIIKNQRALYYEIKIEWTNSDYLSPNYKKKKRQTLYPKEIPYVKFHSIGIGRKGANRSNRFYLFLKEIKLKYDLAVTEYDATINDDSTWQILATECLKKRLKLEKNHALQIFKMIKKGWSSGFETYKAFKEHLYNRYPPN